MAEYYNKFYKHPLNGYDPKYYMIPPKDCRTVFVIIVTTNYVRIVSAIVTVLQLICVLKIKRSVLKI